MSLFKVLLAIFLPPVAVFFTVGLGRSFWVNIVLTLLGGVPGMVHAVYVIAQDDERDRLVHTA